MWTVQEEGRGYWTHRLVTGLRWDPGKEQEEFRCRKRIHQSRLKWTYRSRPTESGETHSPSARRRVRTPLFLTLFLRVQHGRRLEVEDTSGGDFSRSRREGVDVRV